MVEHLVLFRLKTEATEQQVDAMLEALEKLRGKINTIMELSCGRNFSERSNGHAAALRVRFADRAGLAEYIPHPDHQACVETYIKPIVEQVTVVDYEA
ncbi:MAG: Dabb family protein [Armatimonadetes bacterium]|nr:Dabb family protein [Armatimonadota bacterium]